MQLGMIGLGRMGANMVRRLMRGGHECVVWDVNPDNIKKLADEGATGGESPEDFISKLNQPRVVWIMVPAGEATEKTVTDLAARLEIGANRRDLLTLNQHVAFDEIADARVHADDRSAF